MTPRPASQPKYVVYLRVSTAKQGQSGLGLEGQQHAVDTFAAQQGGKVIGSYIEVESGKNADRPELAKAIAHARRSKATLLVAKLDRLARNVALLSALMESGVDFVAADNPNANRLTIHILAAVAEAEAKSISERTKAALQAAKRRGVKLGSARPGHWEGREKNRQKGLEKAHKAAADANRKNREAAYIDLLPTIKELHAKGLSLRQIAAELNRQGHTTRRGKPWNQVQIMRLVNGAA